MGPFLDILQCYFDAFFGATLAILEVFTPTHPLLRGIRVDIAILPPPPGPNASDDEDPEKKINHWGDEDEDMDNLDLNDVDKSELNLGGTEQVITSPLDPSNAINTG